MNTPPPDLPEQAVADAVRAGWKVDPATFEYVALGFGSHHWLATDADGRRWFVTVDDLELKPWLGDDADTAFGALQRCYEIPRRLVDLHEVSYIRASLRSMTGAVIQRIAPRYSVCVREWLDDRRLRAREFDSEDDRDAVLGCLADLHARTDAVRDLALVEDFSIPARVHLEAVLADRDAWGDGVLAAAARVAIDENAVELRHALDAYDDLARHARHDGFVITHGEPHPANWVLTTDGPVLIDWDTPMVAPRERDIARVVGTDRDDAGAYGAELDEDLLLLYALWWELKDVACYSEILRGPHDDNADTRKMLRGLERSSRVRDSFPGLID